VGFKEEALMRLRLLATILGSTALLVAACSSAASPAPAGGASAVGAELSEWAIKLDSSTGKAGAITFSVNNKGEKVHEFVIVKTDLKADSLPVVDDEVDESAFTPVDEIEDIEAGATPSLAVDLQPGHYVILCNLTSHYQKGMHADFDVQ
jgi:uncharacterized cupredoxin-like copper-binding protein